MLDRRQFLQAAILLPLILKNRSPSRFAPLGRPPVPAAMPQGFGLSIPWQNEDFSPGWTDRTLAALDPPWWYDWKFESIGRKGYIPKLWRPALDARFDAAVQAANSHPNVMWFLAYDPDRGSEPHETPKNAAKIGQEWAKSTSVLYAGPGVVCDYNGIAWLKAYLDAGGPIPDAWNIHVYGAKDSATWRQAVEGVFADWYLAEGRKLPIIISQTNSAGQEFVQQRSVMVEVLSMLQEFSPIVAAGWYADRDPLHTMAWADLIRDDGSLTELGQFYAAMDKTPKP